MARFEDFRHDPGWPRWREAAAGAPAFLAPEFFALVRPLVEGNGALVAAAWRDQSLLGALPLALAGRTLTALRSPHSPGFDYAGDEAGLDAIWYTLRRDRRWDELFLLDVPAGSPLATRLPALARASGCPAVLTPGPRQPFFDLPGFEAHLPPKFLHNLRRCARKAGGVELEVITSPTHADLDAALALEAAAWKGAGGSAIATDPRVAHLYHAAWRLFGRRGQARLHFLRAQGERIAVLMTVEDRTTLYALKIGHDPRRAEVSPGHLVVWRVAADAEQRGLGELNFVGQESEWKRRWTDRAHEQVSVRIYRRSPRGLVRWTLREVVKPRLPAELRSQLRTPLRLGCQRDDIVGVHTWPARVRGRLRMGLGIRSGLKRALRRPPPVGAPSKFPVGSWVRVLDAPRLRATLDARDRLRGLVMLPNQWPTCGGVYRVARHVRRLKDDGGGLRNVAGTVLLEGVTCTGTDHSGCGRHCPLMYRDEWLEPAEDPRRGPLTRSTARHAHVRDLDDIRAGLDLFGRRDGVTFLPEMARFCGRRLPIVHRLESVHEHGHQVPTRAPIWMLDGAFCEGQALAPHDTCDRACAFMWHEDWLVLEPPAS